MKKIVSLGLAAVACLLSLALTAAALLWGVIHVGQPGKSVGGESFKAAMMEEYDRYIINQISSALEGVLNIEKVYWLNDSDRIAPEPDPDKFGTTTDPAQMQEILDAAEKLLDGQKTLFRTDVTLARDSEITYYLDDTILCITWKEKIGTSIYTFSEVKIAHASQFRRFLADGQYGSSKQYYCTQMAATVNAVTASNADFYKYRPYGIVVYDGQVYRVNDRVDTCFINDKGEMLLVPRGEISDQATAEAFVEENNVRFSLAFGPILVHEGKNVVPAKYAVGEINEPYSRSGLGYLGDLHYVLVVAGYGLGANVMPTIKEFADSMLSFGCEKAYALDGGQTGTIVTNDRLMNHPDFGTERTVSDIIYFATAMPDGG